MVKLEVIEAFTLGRFGELKNIVRKGIDTPGQLNPGDVFECEKDLADYLLGANAHSKAFVKIIEVIPEEPKVEMPKVEEKPIPKKPVVKKTTKKTSKK